MPKVQKKDQPKNQAAKKGAANKKTEKDEDVTPKQAEATAPELHPLIAATIDAKTDSKIERLRGEMNDGFAGLRQEMKDGDAALRQEMNEGFAGLRQEMKDGEANLRQEMKEGFAALRQEMRDGDAALREMIIHQSGKFDGIESKFDSMESRFDRIESSTAKQIADLKFSMIKYQIAISLAFVGAVFAIVRGVGAGF